VYDNNACLDTQVHHILQLTHSQFNFYTGVVMKDTKNNTTKILLWTKEDLAEAYPQIFRNGIKSVNHWIRLRKLPMVRFSKQGRIYFKPAEIEQFINNHKIEPKYEE